MNRKLNKAEAGYHMLQMLSALDGEFSIQEDLVIRHYLVDNYPIYVNLDAATDYLSALHKDDYILHFQKCMDDFYEDSTPEERISFLNMAVQIIRADQQITNEENIFLRTLYDTWEVENA